MSLVIYALEVNSDHRSKQFPTRWHALDELSSYRILVQILQETSALPAFDRPSSSLSAELFCLSLNKMPFGDSSADLLPG